METNKKTNQLLLEKRTISVKSVLVENLKVALDQFSINGKGETELLLDGNSPEAHAKNRSVEFKKI